MTTTAIIEEQKRVFRETEGFRTGFQENPPHTCIERYFFKRFLEDGITGSLVYLPVAWFDMTYRYGGGDHRSREYLEHMAPLVDKFVQTLNPEFSYFTIVHEGPIESLWHCLLKIDRLTVYSGCGVNFIQTMPEWYTGYCWEQDMPGHADTIRNTTFSYRTTDQYGASRFRFEEPYWMELFGREKCSSLATWGEPVYMYQETTCQQPWPGYDTWSVDSSMTVGTSRMYDAVEQVDRDNPAESAEEQVVPNEYLRIVDPS